MRKQTLTQDGRAINDHLSRLFSRNINELKRKKKNNRKAPQKKGTFSQGSALIHYMYRCMLSLNCADCTAYVYS